MSPRFARLPGRQKTVRARVAASRRLWSVLMFSLKTLLERLSPLRPRITTTGCLGTSRKYGVSHFNGSRARIFVFPDPNYDPSSFYQLPVCISVTCDIAFDLVGPEVSVRDGESVVIRAAVPETSIEEHGNLCPRKDEVGRSPHALERAGRYPVPQSEGVHRRT